MSVDRVGDEFWAQCSECSSSEEFDAEENSFQDVVDQLKGLGWRIFLAGSEWHHECPSCQVVGDDFPDD